MMISAELDFSSPTATVVALGCFDGVHIGHRAVIGEAKAIATERGFPFVVWTFREPPKNFFSPGAVPLITDETAKAEQMRALGVDILFSVPFDQTVCRLTAEEFFRQILQADLKAAHIVCGYNYSFGAGGTGDTRLLERLCRENDVGLTVLPPVTVKGSAVSSSLIRTAMEEGRPEEAAVALGRPYSLRAPVVDGQKLARRLGFPTLNQIFPKGLLVPRYGVYVSRIRADGDSTPRFGITNVGLRPTVGGTLLCAETHILEFNGDLYGKNVTVEFLQFLRPEVRFDSLEALAEQVDADIKKASSAVTRFQ